MEENILTPQFMTCFSLSESIFGNSFKYPDRNGDAAIKEEILSEQTNIGSETIGIIGIDSRY
jgi:hypothetical protein